MSEIQEAIDFYKAQNENMERETWKVAEVCPAYKKNQAAISALQDQAEREKGCEYCTTIEEQNDYGRTFYKTLYEDVGPTHLNGTACLCHDKDGWFIHYEDNEGESMCDCKTDFCPNCGRDLRNPVEK